MPVKEAQDRADVLAVRGGDRDAYRGLVERHGPRLMTFCLRLVQGQEEAEELAHRTFVRAFESLESYDVERPFYPWLSTIAFRLAQRQWSDRTRRASFEAEYAEEEAHRTRSGEHLERLGFDEASERLWKAVSRLSRGERTATHLYYMERFTVSESARIMGVSPGTVKSFLYRARTHLRERLGGTLLTELGDEEDDTK